jgi:ADP-heptose:LPS heptosyltransferase
VVTGGPGELAVGAAVVAAMRAPAVDLTGATSLGGLAVLLRDAAVLVGNDTGSAHLAAAVGARSVTVFLPGDPVRWAHPGPRHRALAADVPCAPCPHLVCPIDFRCADSVRPGDVLAAARALVPR